MIEKRFVRGMNLFFVMATRKVHALLHMHLTTANQSEIRKAYLVSVHESVQTHN